MEIDWIAEACYEKVREQQAKLQRCTTQEERESIQKETLHRYRLDLEPYVFQHLMMKYGPALDQHWKTHQFPQKSQYAWMIVERRCHPNWWFVLRNLAWAAPHFSIYLFCSNENIDFLKQLLGDKCHSVHLIPWFHGFATREIGIQEYNRALTSEALYQMIDAEYVIVAQLDTYVRYPIPQSIFMTDYYGSPWAWKPMMPGGGGLSVRKIQSMIRICKEGKQNHGLQEDDWISENIAHLDLNYPSFEIRCHIFSENFPVENPLGVHQFWTFLHNFEIHRPEAFKEHLRRYLTLHMG